MRSIGSRVILASFVVVASVCVAAISSDSPARKELKRADLSGAPGMEVITSTAEYKKGDEIPRHFHHGVETGYILQGTMVQVPGKDPMMLETGAPIMNLRDVPHAGYKVVGDTPLKLVTVHIVDKGKPLYEWVK
jgi:quercetin dioxygenase-like cupin family protein